ncbi:P1 family peptidase, partial [Peptoniphilus sp. oral taxon 386]
MYSGYLTDVGNLKVGHAQNFDGLTGVTVIIPEKGAVCGVDVRGSAPGTRETDLLRPENLVEKVNCVMLSGGSAYGLNAASGIMKYLEEKELGMDVTV